MSSPAIANDPGPHYIVFDNKTGRILQTHSRFNIEAQKNVEIPMEELTATFRKDRYIIDRLTGRDEANLGVLVSTGDDPGPDSSRFKVDVEKHKLVLKPVLTVTAEKTEIAGDGEDSTKIEIQAVGEDGKPDRSLDDKLKVTTTRGKLSARGGIVEMRQGQASVTLTSVKETVDRVQVVVTSVEGTCGPGRLNLEFV